MFGGAAETGERCGPDFYPVLCGRDRDVTSAVGATGPARWSDAEDCEFHLGWTGMKRRGQRAPRRMGPVEIRAAPSLSPRPLSRRQPLTSLEIFNMEMERDPHASPLSCLTSKYRHISLPIRRTSLVIGVGPDPTGWVACSSQVGECVKHCGSYTVVMYVIDSITWESRCLPKVQIEVVITLVSDPVDHNERGLHDPTNECYHHLHRWVVIGEV